MEGKVGSILCSSLAQPIIDIHYLGIEHSCCSIIDAIADAELVVQDLIRQERRDVILDQKQLLVSKVTILITVQTVLA